MKGSERTNDGWRKPLLAHIFCHSLSLLFPPQETSRGAEVIAVDDDAVLRRAAEEAAVQPCVVHLQQEGVVLPFLQGHQVASPLLAEEEGIQPHLPRHQDIETYCVIA